MQKKKKEKAAEHQRNVGCEQQGVERRDIQTKKILETREKERRSLAKYTTKAVQNCHYMKEEQERISKRVQKKSRRGQEESREVQRKTPVTEIKHEEAKDRLLRNC